MADYVVVIDGAGEGCDYCIDCNVREEVEECYDSDEISSYSVYEIKKDLTAK
jgi:hypothetical protein